MPLTAFASLTYTGTATLVKPERKRYNPPPPPPGTPQPVIENFPFEGTYVWQISGGSPNDTTRTIAYRGGLDRWKGGTDWEYVAGGQEPGGSNANSIPVTLDGNGKHSFSTTTTGTVRWQGIGLFRGRATAQCGNDKWALSGGGGNVSVKHEDVKYYTVGMDLPPNLP